ncbi:MAG: permease [Christensenellaceae bacterium]|jgi:uncharacterized membrane protein YraQ (UPF0718 family)|nr:permease [Christensenellaceae bacterium]
MPQEHVHSHFSLLVGPVEALLEGPLLRLGLPEEGVEIGLHALADFLDISLLLLVAVGLVCFLQTFIPYDRMREKLLRIKGPLGFMLALGLGFFSPFCSCSVIPILMGFLAAGVPLRYCLVFLSSASALNLTALTAVFAAFPMPFALSYALSALLACLLGANIAAVGGEKDLKAGALSAQHEHHHHEEKSVGRLWTALCGAGEIYGRVWPFVLLGVTLSALVTGLLSEEMMNGLLIGNPLALPLAVLLGGGLHSDVFSISPIVRALLDHSTALGLGFLLGTMLFSVAEWALLSRIFKAKLIAKYCASLLTLSLCFALIAWLVF